MNGTFTPAKQAPVDLKTANLLRLTRLASLAGIAAALLAVWWALTL